MKITKREDASTLETVKGRRGEILMAGEKCMMMINTIEPGIPTPPHSHPHEQIGFLIEGRGILYIDDETQEEAFRREWLHFYDCVVNGC